MRVEAGELRKEPSMADLVHSFDATKAVKARLVVKVTFDRTFRLRMWLAIQMLRVVSWVCPITVSVEHV